MIWKSLPSLDPVLDTRIVVSQVLELQDAPLSSYLSATEFTGAG